MRREDWDAVEGGWVITRWIAKGKIIDKVEGMYRKRNREGSDANSGSKERPTNSSNRNRTSSFNHESYRKEEYDYRGRAVQRKKRRRIGECCLDQARCASISI